MSSGAVVNMACQVILCTAGQFVWNRQHDMFLDLLPLIIGLLCLQDLVTSSEAMAPVDHHTEENMTCV